MFRQATSSVYFLFLFSSSILADSREAIIAAVNSSSSSLWPPIPLWCFFYLFDPLNNSSNAFWSIPSASSVGTPSKLSRAFFCFFSFFSPSGLGIGSSWCQLGYWGILAFGMVLSIPILFFFAAIISSLVLGTITVSSYKALWKKIVAES